MTEYCKTEKELANAIKNNADCIIIEGSTGNKVYRIMVTGKVAWGVCAASLGIAIVCYMSTPVATVATTPAGGAASFLSGVTATGVAASTLGSAVLPAVAIGVAGGGIGALNKLRDEYRIVEKNKNYIKLQRK